MKQLKLVSLQGNVISISAETQHKNATMSKKNLSDNRTQSCFWCLCQL